MDKRILLKAKTIIVASAIVATSLIGAISVSASTASTGMRDITALELVNDMKLGWNLGNTFDAGDETDWGNPVTTHAMIDTIKAKGFNTIRIPVTWKNHIGSSPDYTIDQTFLDRVEEVVNYALDDDMYVIINIHHDNTWVVPTYAHQTETTAELTKVWTQIANQFKSYSDYVLFETLNEPREVGSTAEWTGGTAENRDVVNQYNLAAVNAIRATGGNNAIRFIMVPTICATDLTVAMNDFVVPNDDSRVIVSLHTYTPYYFSMVTTGTSYWGSDSDKSTLDTELDTIYNKFVKNGRAVVIGEFGSINKSNQSSRAAHAKYFVQASRARGITAIWWDNGFSTAGEAESYGIFNRNTLTWDCPEVAEALVEGLNSAITPTTAIFDLNTANQADIPVTMTLNGNTLSGIYNGTAALVQGTDYTVSDNTVTILKAYLAKQSAGTVDLTFKFSAGTDKVLAVTVTDTTGSGTATDNLKVQMYNGVTQASVNGITPRYKITNTGSTAIDLSKVTLRYYFTEDGTESQSFWCDWSTIGSANVTGSFTKLLTAKTGADTYLEVGFTSGAGTLAAGASVEVQIRFSKSDWSNYDQSDDYSFDSSDTSYADCTKVTAYLDGSKAWGVEPS